MVSPTTAAGISDRAISIDVLCTQEDEAGSAVQAIRTVAAVRAGPKLLETDANPAVMREP